MNIFAVLVVLLLIWLLLTVLVTVGTVAMIRLTTKKPSGDHGEINITDDIEAANRVVNRLERAGIINREAANLWRADVYALRLHDASLAPEIASSTGSIPPAVEDNQPSVGPISGIAAITPPSAHDASPPIAATIADGVACTSEHPTLPTILLPETGDQNRAATTPSEFPSAHDEIRQHDRKPASSVDSFGAAARPRQPSVPSKPAAQAPAALAPARPTIQHEPSLTISEVITSFLAAHNIRWGELVAGMLIVVCSIGLVISLWNTLMQTHRVIPSLIFLTANTAIFAAGLYTLSRWRLFHTSRAMLVIATLLVPLSILAGLATTGTGAAAVALTDPITVGAILGIGTVYLVLLWLGSKALVGQRDAAAMVLSVAGPSAMLPLLPATIRGWGSSASLLIAGGSLALFAALSWVVWQSRQTQRRVLGTAAGRHRVLIMSVGGFALSMLIGNVAYILPDSPHRLLRIALAAIPGLVAIAASGQSLTVSRRQPKLALAGTVIFVMATLACFAIMPPSMIGAPWLWTWAFVLAGAAVLAAVTFRQPDWLPVATVSAGLGVMFWAPVFFRSIAWQDIALWQRFIGGEPMLAALSIGATVLLASRFAGQSEYRKPLELAGAGWTALALLIALVLCVAPHTWLGSVPPGVVSFVLGVVAAGCMGAPHQLIAKHAGWITIPFWLSIFRPVALGMPLAAPNVWMMTGLSIAATLVVISELARRWRSVDTIETWQTVAAGTSLLASLIAVVFVSQGWIDSTLALVAGTVLLWWIGLSQRQAAWVQMSQIASLAAALIIGWGRCSETLLSQQSWATGVAPWGWVILLASLTLVWLAVRELCQLGTGVGEPRSWMRPLAWYSDHQNSETRSLEWIFLQATVFAIAVAAIVSFASLVIGVWRQDIFAIQISVLLPLLGVASTGAALYAARRTLLPSQLDLWRRLEFSASACLLVWSAVQLAIGLLTDPTQQLVLATSAVAIACLAADDWIRRPQRLDGSDHPRDGVAGARISDLISRSIPMATGVAVVSLSTITLFGAWCGDVFEGETPQTFGTCAMAAWAILGAAVAARHGYQQSDAASVNLSAVLTPVATVLVMPLLHDSPVVWVQWAAIACSAWALVATACFPTQPGTSKDAVTGALGFTMIIGLICSLTMVVFALRPTDDLTVFGSIGGIIVSVISTALLVAGHRKFLPRQSSIWPISITLLSGQMTWIAINLEWISNQETVLLSAIWLLAAVAATSLYAVHVVGGNRQIQTSHFWHAGLMTSAVCLLSVVESSPVHDWIGLTACVIGGLLVTAVAWQRVDSDQLGWQLALVSSTRVLGWLVLGFGGYFTIELADLNPHHWDTWSALFVWIGVWIIGWRLACPDVVGDSGEPAFRFARRALPDSDASLLVAAALIGELFLVVSAAEFLQLPTWSDPLLWLRTGIAIAIAAAICFRTGRRTAWESSLTIGILAVAILAVRAGVDYGADWQRRVMLASLSASCLMAILVYTSRTSLAVAQLAMQTWTATIDRFDSRSAGHLTALPIPTNRFAVAAWRLSLVAASVISVVIAWQLVALSTDANIPITIGAVALLAIAVAELAAITRQSTMRHATVTIGFAAIGMWASVNVGSTAYPLLTASMQWLVAWVFTAAVVGIAVPKLFGRTVSDRWQDALRFAVITAGALATASLVVMFTHEVWIRTTADIDSVSRTWVYFIAATLAMLSIVATLLSILSGPGFSYRDIWRFSDRTRTGLIVGAQVAGGLTWLHLHLCKSPLAHLGLRPYWPYIVMALAFISVGITAWAQRRGDHVLQQSLRQTALYLPLIPVLGFWLSGATFGWGGQLPGETWAYIQGKVSYQSLLAIGALYYGGLAFLWRGTMPRVTSMILGNTALWVILIQTPNWDFLSHPQAWLIPPAVCVLVVAHLYRDRLEPAVASGIRYAAALMIYVSSTADMLLQDIGSTLAGPIVLVLLALAGMCAGVVLRVRPFLYLGAIFVFIGVTSMVWHAQQRIDEVWPWWAFGITTGILLLAGLMAIEKNKPKLRTLAHSLASWEP